MKLTTKLTTCGLLATLVAASVSPVLADGYRDRASQQTNKNTMRNLGIAGAAVAAYGLFSHNDGATLLGVAGAALAGNQYEKDRQQQSQDNSRYYYRDGRNQGGSQYRDNNQYSYNARYQGNTRNWNNSQFQGRRGNQDTNRYQENNGRPSNDQRDRSDHRR